MGDRDGLRLVIPVRVSVTGLWRSSPRDRSDQPWKSEQEEDLTLDNPTHDTILLVSSLFLATLAAIDRPLQPSRRGANFQRHTLPWILAVAVAKAAKRPGGPCAPDGGPELDEDTAVGRDAGVPLIGGVGSDRGAEVAGRAGAALRLRAESQAGLHRDPIHPEGSVPRGVGVLGSMG